ncbi:unnamed protein product [Parnassius mnemosyne]|uniref:Regulatory protein zeste n=1 Tax=Parnassius mnemosyne TaxID=213953 RepID=A0AAV1KJN1_9NEOP
MTRVSQAQMEQLLDLLSENGVMIQGKVMYTNTNRHNFWKKVAQQLNDIEGGAFKNAYKWCKMWADWKNKTKTKADILLKKKKNEFMPQPIALTNLELRLLQIISYPMGDSLQPHFEMMHKVELPDNTKNEIPIEFLVENSNELQLNNRKAVSNEEDKNVLKYFATCKRDLADSEEIIDEESELLNDLSDTGRQRKMEEKEVMTSTTSFEDFKSRITLALEKERLQQKNEELRLRAIELKLKEEELRLKELEMNKVNYLTNLEEEKLKCFRDISASLKELLELTRNGSLRLSNGM